MKRGGFGPCAPKAAYLKRSAAASMFSYSWGVYLLFFNYSWAPHPSWGHSRDQNK